MYYTENIKCIVKVSKFQFLFEFAIIYLIIKFKCELKIFETLTLKHISTDDSHKDIY